MPWTSAYSAQPARSLANLAAAFDRPEELARRSAAVDDWQELLGCAFSHGLGGLLAHQLGEAGVALPSTAVQHADEILAQDRLWSRRQHAGLYSALEALDGAGVQAVVLKGLPLAERLYPAPHLRPAGDIDLLTGKDRFEAARRALKSLDLTEVERAPTPHGPPHAIEFTRTDGLRVELHRQASSRRGTTLAANAFLARAVEHRLSDGRAVHLLESADECLYLAVHAARHRLTRLRWLWELGRLLDQADESLLSDLVARANDSRVNRALAVSLWVLHQRLECPAAGDCARRLPGGPLLRIELALAGHIPGPGYSGRGLAKGLFTLSEHTYRALLNDRAGAALRQWMSAVKRSAAPRGRIEA